MAARLGEFDRIAAFFKPLATHPAALGLTDDAALLAVPEGQELVVTTDVMVAGVHFLPDEAADAVASKLLRVNLSDLAAMGARPLAYTLTTALPGTLDEAWLEIFAAGLGRDQDRYGIALIGGDSVSTPGPVVVGVTAFGTVPAGSALRRSGARPGDALFVSGTIGDAALGLRIALGQLEVTGGDGDALVGRMRRPEPRVALGQGLRGLAGAAMDISDGLVQDAGHIASASGVALVIEAQRVPLSDAARRCVERDGALLRVALTGGDDYELLFAIPPHHESALRAAASACRTPVTRIGHVAPGQGVVVRDLHGNEMELRSGGWQHF